MPTTRPNRPGLPPFTLALIYVLLVAAPLLASFFTGAEHRQWLMRASAATGIAAGVMILLQMVTSGRFEAISGRIGIDVTMAFHKWSAPFALGLALLHVLLFIGPPDPDRPNRVYRRLEIVLTGDGFGDARIALVLLAILVGMALMRDRLPLRYEVWRATHLLVALGLIATMIAHILSMVSARGTGGIWIVLALSVVLPAASVYARRLTRPTSHQWRVHETRQIAERLWKLTITHPDGAPLRFEAGQFAWIATGAKRLPLHDHPFSIASAPEDPDLTFLIQEAGDFTRAIGAITPGTPVSIDAPHGSFVSRFDGPLLLIAGGVGMAPILSLLRHFAAQGTQRPVRLIYAARSADAMIPEEMFRPACEALGVTPILISDRAEPDGNYRRGPLDAACLEAALGDWPRAEVEALICGPGPMMTFAADTLAGLGVPLERIEYERFRYSAEDSSRKDRRVLLAFAGLWGTIAASVLLYCGV